MVAGAVRWANENPDTPKLIPPLATADVLVSRYPTTPTPTSEPTLAPTEVPYVPAGEVEEQFFAGYRAAGGGAKRDNALWKMIQCKSTWQVNPPGDFLGLAQFEPGSWRSVSAITGYTDWLDPFSQGYNTSVWASIVSPGSTAGWVNCWWR